MRFQMELPLSITRTGAKHVALPGFTKNISSTGVLFTSGARPDLGGSIEYIITLNLQGPQRVNLRCMGKVLRAEDLLDSARLRHADAVLRYNQSQINLLAALGLLEERTFQCTTASATKPAGAIR